MRVRAGAWFTLLAILLPGATAYAQGPRPYGPPPYGYPGYPPPMMPYGYPPALMPAAGGSANLPSEPYYVPREDPPVKQAGPYLPPADQPIVQTGRRADARRDAAFDAAPYLAAPPPAEPYTLYEGKRSLAEMKEDCTRVWTQVNFIHWWTRRDSTPPLLTTGDPNNLRAGTLGFPDTKTLLGDGGIAPNELSGIQATIGMWLDEERLQSLELGGFWLGKIHRNYPFSSDAGGSPVLAQPILINGDERALQLTVPGLFAGNFNVSTSMDFYGAELNFARNSFRINRWTMDVFAGARYLYLNETLAIDQRLNVLPLGAFSVPFNNVLQPDGTSFLFNDSFAVTNRFYGGQLGARANFTFCNFDLGATAKLGMGATTHTFLIDGTTTLLAPGNAPATLSGGTLAQASNIGRYTSTDFSFVPELITTLGYQLTPHLRLTMGYNLIYWNNVQRIGNQIDRQIDFTQVPTAGNFVPGAVATHPAFPNTRTDFWAMGVNVGVELRY